MSRLSERLTGVGPWQAIAIVAVAAGAIGGGIAAFAMTGASGSDALEEGQQLVEVRRGDLVNQITSSGSIAFPNRESLYFGAQGTVAGVGVAVGDQVTEGQELARLDDDTLAQLRRQLAQAQFDLQQAAEAFEQAQTPHTALEVAQAQSAAAKAELAFKTATTAWEEVQTPLSEQDIQEARSEKATAENSLQSAQDDLAFQLVDQAERVEEARKALTTGEDTYRTTVKSFLGMTLSETELRMNPDDLLETYAIDLDFLFDKNRRTDEVSKQLLFSPESIENQDTPWSEFTVYTWINLYAGNVLGTCAGVTLRAEDVCVRTQLDQSWATLNRALSAWRAAETTASKSISSAMKAVDQATAALSAAEENLEEVLNGVDPLEATVKQREMEVAKAQLDQANEDLSEAVAPPDPLTLSLREAEMKAAAAKVGTAEQQLTLAVLRAPFDGFVGAVNIEVGRAAGPNAAAIEVVDPSVAEVDARLDEIDVLTVQVGANALVSLDGLPGIQLPGVVTGISQTGANQQGVVTYPIQIQVQTPGRLQLREGLSATASIVLLQESDVLLIPSTSIAGTIEQPTVLVSFEGKITEREVTLGNSDGFWTAVLSGLEEGDTVVSTSQGGSSPFFGNIARLGGFGGLGGVGGGLRGQGGNFRGPGGGGFGGGRAPQGR